MTEFETLQFTRTGSIVNIVLDRPDAANGMNAAMTRDLAAAATLCDTAETKVVTLTGAGRFFCAGGDLKAMAAADDPGAFVKGIANAAKKLVAKNADLIVANDVSPDSPWACPVIWCWPPSRRRSPWPTPRPG